MLNVFIIYHKHGLIREQRRKEGRRKANIKGVGKKSRENQPCSACRTRCHSLGEILNGHLLLSYLKEFPLIL